MKYIRGFSNYQSRAGPMFLPNSEIQKIDRFSRCPSLHRIEIPSSLCLLDAFNDCNSLIEVTFEAESHVIIICRCNECQSLCRIEFPPSGKSVCGFHKCDSLRDVVVKPGSCVIHNVGFQNTHPFLVYDEMDLK
jgi:hypothetical protein